MAQPYLMETRRSPHGPGPLVVSKEGTGRGAADQDRGAGGRGGGMAFRDDLRALAGQAQRQLEQGVQQAQEVVEEYRQRRRFNELARDLGRTVYYGRKQGTVDETAVARISAQMAAVEAEIAQAARPGGTGHPSGQSGGGTPTGDA
jgi:hypothetical protein